MSDVRTRGEAPLLWIVLLTVASLLTTLVFACATPFRRWRHWRRCT